MRDLGTGSGVENHLIDPTIPIAIQVFFDALNPIIEGADPSRDPGDRLEVVKPIMDCFLTDETTRIFMGVTQIEGPRSSVSVTPAEQRKNSSLISMPEGECFQGGATARKGPIGISPCGATDTVVRALCDGS